MTLEVSSPMRTVTNPVDVASIERFFHAHGYGDFSAGTLHDMMGFAHNKLIMIADDDKQPMAALCYRLLEDEAEIIEIAVRQDKRRQGFGAKLMQELQRRLVGTAAKRLLLEVAETNQEAVSFYHHFGFQDIARRHAYYHNRIDAIIMELRLSKA